MGKSNTGLDHDIFLTQHFAIKGHPLPPKTPSVCKSPKNYVLGYIVKEDGVERIAPVKLYDKQDGSAHVYADRADAIDKAMSEYLDVLDMGKLKNDLYQLQEDGGTAFGRHKVSLSQSELSSRAKEIQKMYDQGKTAMYLVISFPNDYEYLKQYGVIPEDFDPPKEDDDLSDPGKRDLRGVLDQLKLRTAVMSAMERLASTYDDLEYVGSIHLDRKHPHCHLLFIDKGVGNLVKDGTQRGKINAYQKQILRSAIDASLKENQHVPYMSSSYERDDRNLKCYLKQYTTNMIANRGELQLILASLPQDRTKWYANSDDRSMVRANNLAKAYVTNLFSRADSGYNAAMNRVESYARGLVRRNGMSDADYDRLVDMGRDRITNAAIDGVYSVLKTVREEDLSPSTPFTSLMASDYGDLVSSIGAESDASPMLDFGFKFRTYQSRLDHHRDERRKYHDAAKEYEARMSAGEYDEQSLPVYDFFKEEEEYNSMLIYKYSWLLPLGLSDVDYDADFRDYLYNKQRVENMQKMIGDDAFSRMKAENAERYGYNKYHEIGGFYMVTNPSMMTQRLLDMQSSLSQKQEHLFGELADHAMRYDEASNSIVPVSNWKFANVKAVDLHRLGYDFAQDVTLQDEDVKRFTDVATRRYEAFIRARYYLEKTNQSEALAQLPVADIEMQHDVVEYFVEGKTLPARRAEVESKPVEVKTLPIDYGAYAEQELAIRRMVRENINSLEYEYE